MPRTPKDLFSEALELSGADRAAYLAAACADEPLLRAKVEELLGVYEGAGRFMAGPTVTGAGPAAEAPGTRVGRYRLLEQIGEGGFGVVFMAEQEEPVRRRVAVKVIKLGMDTRAVVARFEAERQALAVMDHPGIAKVLDGGATETGRPYFVMELVSGDPITAYCDRHRLTVSARLELFAQVCDAVQHAHQKGIIHRDIKPGNVLVATRDDRPHAKVVDFGIAKATDHRLTEKTLFTEHRALLGTPEYMSPEQAESAVDIDTRTDVYSLGVLLYEILTGGTPFDGQRLRSAAYAEIQRIIREEEPEKPSTRLSRAHDSLASIAAGRHTEPRRLGQVIRGDLDWIVMKCLEKDRGRRYESPSALAADVQRHLRGDPVVAAPPSVMYRTHKFVRRNRVGVIAGGATMAAILAGVATIAWSAHTARLVAAATRKHADELKQVADFQAGMFADIDVVAAGFRLTDGLRTQLESALRKSGVADDERDARTAVFRKELREINATDAARRLIDQTVLGPAVAVLDLRFKDQPAVDAQLSQTLAKLYRDLGLYDKALPLRTRALETRRKCLGDDHEDTISSLLDMCLLLHDQKQPADAEKYGREALDRSRRILGPDSTAAIDSCTAIGLVLQDQNRIAEAQRYYEEAMERSRRVLGDNDPNTIDTINNMGYMLQAQHRFADAEPYFREALERIRQLHGDSAKTLTVLNNLGFVLHYQGKLDAAEPYLRESLEKGRRLWGDEHPNTLSTMTNLGKLYRDQRRFADADRLLSEALETGRRVWGDDHPATFASISDLGALREAQGRLDEAEAYDREAMERCRRVLGAQDHQTLQCITLLGFLLRQRGKLPDAEALFRQALETKRRTLVPDDPELLDSVAWMGTVLSEEGRFAEAESFFREALDGRSRAFGEEHTETINAIVRVGGILVEQGKLEPAEPYYFRAMNLSRRVRGNDHPETLVRINNLARLLIEEEKFAQAEPLCREAMEGRRRVLGNDHADTVVSIGNLGSFFLKQGKPGEGEPYYREAIEISRRVSGADHLDTINLLSNMGELLRQQGKLADAEATSREALAASRRVMGEGHPLTVACTVNLAKVLRTQKRNEEAVALLVPAEAITRGASAGGTASRLPSVLAVLGRARMDMGYEAGRFALAESNLLEARESLVKSRGVRHSETTGCARDLIGLYTAWEQAEPGKGYEGKAVSWRAVLDAAPGAPASGR